MVLIVIAAAWLTSPKPTFANAGPHGAYNDSTSACAACHRAHTGIGGNLLIAPSEDDLCTVCHGTAGTGANTNVLDGVYLNRVPGGSQQGVFNDPLNGGGFLYFKQTTTTSAHNVVGLDARGYEAPGMAGTGKTAPAWGGGSAVGLSWNGGTPPASLTALRCISCHNPHGTASYRVLRNQTDTYWAGAGPWPTVRGETAPGTENYTLGGSYDAAEMSLWCANCHSNYVLQTSTYDAGDGAGAVTRYRHAMGYSPGCLTCHRSHGTNAQMTGVAANVAPAHDSALLRLDNRGVCASCHLIENAMAGQMVMAGPGCNVCHQSPPPTGTHYKHYSPTSTVAPAYGRTGNLSTNTAYTFGCGECHPVDHAQHNNGLKNPGGGSAEIELCRPGYAQGNKQFNTSLATYTPGSTLFTDTAGFSYTLGTCSSIYCHSGNQVVSSSDVPLPKGYDADGNLIYDPYTFQTARRYQTMTWGGAGPISCSGCHDYPQRSYYPDVKAGVGQSHSWIDDQGEENLHMYNMGSGPLNCRTCHYGAVKDAYPWWTSNVSGVVTLGEVPIYNRALHVNGVKDVQFDTVNGAQVRARVFNLAGVVWDPVNKTCASAPCHLNQTKPKWGTPYRWQNTMECNVCHRY